MTDRAPAGHSGAMGSAAVGSTLELGSADAGATAGPPRLEELYHAHFDFVWRSARRLGVADGAVDDVVQEVFLVAHRRIASFEGRSSPKSWLFGILVRVASDHRRRQRRKGGLAPLPEALPDESRSPAKLTAERERVRLLHRLLDSLDEDKRAVFVLAELEQMTAPEIAEALGVKLNTVYSRLRAARKAFDAALARHRAREVRR